jgi:hypothetical protein
MGMLAHGDRRSIHRFSAGGVVSITSARIAMAVASPVQSNPAVAVPSLCTSTKWATPPLAVCPVHKRCFIPSSRHQSASPPSTIGSVAHRLKFGDDPISMVALDFNVSIPDRATGAKPGFQFRGKLGEAVLVQR